MPQNSIYVLCDGEEDYSRWLTMRAIDSEWIELQLDNLCNPGHVSQLTRMRCPAYALRDVIDGGFIQVRCQDGFVTLFGGETIEIAFSGTEDKRTTRCTFSNQEFASLAGRVAENLLSVPVPV